MSGLKEEMLETPGYKTSSFVGMSIATSTISAMAVAPIPVAVRIAAIAGTVLLWSVYKAGRSYQIGAAFKAKSAAAAAASAAAAQVRIERPTAMGADPNNPVPTP